jgi:hypothetical protein
VPWSSKDHAGGSGVDLPRSPDLFSSVLFPVHRHEPLSTAGVLARDSMGNEIGGLVDHDLRPAQPRFRKRPREARA